MWDLLNSFDFGITRWLNGFAGANDYVDYFAWRFANNDLIKGGVMVGLLWGVWSLDRPGRDTNSDIIRTFVGMIVAIFIGRALQVFLPHRQRPLHEPALDFRLPENMPGNAMDGWSSFPSDHGVLYIAIAVALMFRFRIVGAFALSWAIVVIFLPRLYLGLHYLSDIVVGGALGAALMAVVMIVPAPENAMSALSRWRARHPILFQALAFMATFEAASQFRGSRFFVSSFAYYLGILEF